VDDARIAELLWALMLVDVEEAPKLDHMHEGENDTLPSRAFALLKPLFLPWALDFSREAQKWRYDWNADHSPIKLEPRILPLLRAGRTEEACAIAERRLFVSGVPPLRGAASLGGAVDPARLAAALLLPVRNEDLDRLLSLVAHPPVMEFQGA
jgi:CRISPR-associated protein Csx17